MHGVCIQEQLQLCGACTTCLTLTPLLWLTGLFSKRGERWDCPLYVHYLNFFMHPGQLGLS